MRDLLNPQAALDRGQVEVHDSTIQSGPPRVSSLRYGFIGFILTCLRHVVNA